jgi:hypothetical protein
MEICQVFFVFFLKKTIQNVQEELGYLLPEAMETIYSKLHKKMTPERESLYLLNNLN